MSGMNEVVYSVLKIQNRSKSLKWGHCRGVNRVDEVFAVGHKSYRGVTHYIVVRGMKVFNADRVEMECLRECSSVREVVDTVVKQLQEWFPARDVSVSKEE